VAVFPEHGTNGSAVLEAADRALYAAKAAGRDACRTADAAGPRHAAMPTAFAGPPTQPTGESIPKTGASHGTQPTRRPHGG